MFRRTSTLMISIVVAACAADQPSEREAATEEPPAAGTEEAPAGAEQPPAGPEQAITGGIEIAEPTDGAVVGPDMRIVMNPVGVEVEAATATREPGRGHLHLLVDHDLTTAGEPIPADIPGIIHLGDGSTEYSLTDLAPGEHRIIAVFGYGDHVPMERVATDTVQFVVQEP